MKLNENQGKKAFRCNNAATLGGTENTPAAPV